MKDTIVGLYIIGAVLAFAYSLFDVYTKDKEGKDVSQWPLMLPYITFLSWIYIGMVVWQYKTNKD